MSNYFKNIAAALFALALFGTAVHLVKERDEKIMSSSRRWGTLKQSHHIRATEDEQRIALQFADTTLPEMKRLGLITRYTRTEAETIITVSGKIWNKRSEFFKEKFLDQIFIYNKVNNFALNTKVIDDRTARVYAQIVPPDKRLIF